MLYIVLQKLEKVGLQQVGMRLDLVHSGRNLRSLQQLLGRVNGKIADADTPNLARCHEPL
jgi:hypothetical protein